MIRPLSIAGLVVACTLAACGSDCNPEPTASKREACIEIARIACQTCSAYGPAGAEQGAQPDECLVQATESGCDRYPSESNPEDPLEAPECLEECLAKWKEGLGECEYVTEEMPDACEAVFYPREASFVERNCRVPAHEPECGYVVAE